MRSKGNAVRLFPHLAHAASPPVCQVQEGSEDAKAIRHGNASRADMLRGVFSSARDSGLHGVPRGGDWLGRQQDKGREG